MHFEIDRSRYVVAIAARPILLDGEVCKAKVDHKLKRIWLSDQLPKHERRAQLFHELRHCWIGAHGRAGDDEADAVQAGAMMDDLFEQYQQQGGDAVLEALAPAPDAPIHRQPSGALARTEAHCGYCGAAVACGSIANGKPEWLVDLGQWVTDRGILCFVCDKITTWRECATAEGMATGMIVPHPPPRVLAGAEAAEWLREHGKIAGVVCA